MRSRLQPIVLAAAIVVVVVVAITLGRGGYLGELISRAGETGSPVAVHDLSSIGMLQQTFNAQTGAPRLILVVSPT
jgi:mRNA-degrading endonuclease toxin of MazEF toxin-antitoxin module